MSKPSGKRFINMYICLFVVVCLIIFYFVMLFAYLSAYAHVRQLSEKYHYLSSHQRSYINLELNISKCTEKKRRSS